MPRHDGEWMEHSSQSICRMNADDVLACSCLPGKKGAPMSRETKMNPHKRLRQCCGELARKSMPKKTTKRCFCGDKDPTGAAVPNAPRPTSSPPPCKCTQPHPPPSGHPRHMEGEARQRRPVAARTDAAAPPVCPFAPRPRPATPP